MGTACWGTNESFDCHWISFGYGSRNDTSMLWLSLEAYLALSRLDDLEMGNYFGDISFEEYRTVSPFRAYKFASETIHYTDLEKQLEWFEQARKSRQYYIKNPEKIEEKARDEAIRKRVYEMYWQSGNYNIAYSAPYDGCFVTNEELHEMIESWFDPVEIKKEQDARLAEAEKDDGVLPGYDGKQTNYDFVTKLHESPEYQKRDIYTMGGVAYTSGWKQQCVQRPINWLGESWTPPQKYADSNPNMQYRWDEADRPDHNWKERLEADEWDRINNWKGN